MPVEGILGNVPRWDGEIWMEKGKKSSKDALVQKPQEMLNS